MPYKKQTIAVVIPAHNEEQSIGLVITELLSLSDRKTNQPLLDDIVVCDNGSTDDTANAVLTAGVRLVNEPQLGYGAACLAAISALTQCPPDVVLFVDGDHSVDSAEVVLLLDEINRGADLVIGCRVKDKQQAHALTLHQRFGNQLASILIRLLWSTRVTDLGPFRAIRYCALMQLDMRDRQFGWTVEMQVKAIQQNMAISEVAVSSLQRIGKSKISGTVRGTIGAARGIFGMIFNLYRQQHST